VTVLVTPPQVAVTVWFPVALHRVVKVAPVPVAGFAEELVVHETVPRLLPCAVKIWGSPANSEALVGVMPVRVQPPELELEPELPLELELLLELG